VQKELKDVEEDLRKADLKQMQAESKRQTELRKLKLAIDQQQTAKVIAKDINEAQKVSDKQRAIELENMPMTETIKRAKDQEMRRKAVE